MLSGVCDLITRRQLPRNSFELRDKTLPGLPPSRLILVISNHRRKPKYTPEDMLSNGRPLVNTGANH